MKTISNRYKILGLLTALVVTIFFACKKDTGGTSAITGKWNYENNGNAAVIEQYEFKSDGTFALSSYQVDANKNITGYIQKISGNYVINKTALALTNLVFYSNPSGNFGPVNVLTIVSGPATENYTIGLNGQKNQLSLYFTCPPNADCVPSPIIYNKQ